MSPVYGYGLAGGGLRLWVVVGCAGGGGQMPPVYDYGLTDVGWVLCVVVVCLDGGGWEMLLGVGCDLARLGR
ncbi:hypothetical protein ACIBO5_09165 [Nonomuraea angiospora]|uniref:hypothetical protein n=1 Tax=Nonomuraea angiospora TaxID=46172 RepID=UPI00378CCE57